MDMTMARTSQRPIFALVVLALLIAALVATTVFSGSQRPPLSAPLFGNGAVVFEQDDDLYIADQLGADPRPLVATGSDRASNPVFSPQGDRVAFVRDVCCPGQKQVVVVNPDGTGVKVVASELDSISLQLSWAPDGSAILASEIGSWRSDSPPLRLYLIESDGSGFRSLDGGPDVPAGQGAWRPNGRHIAFLGWQDQVPAVFIADPDGTNVRRLPVDNEDPADDPAWGTYGLRPSNTSGRVMDRPMEWSPDGTRLSVVSTSPDNVVQITIADIDADGAVTGSHQLSPLSAAAELGPRWSPDGDILAVALREGGSLKVGLFEPDGSGYRVVGAVSDLVGTGFAWSPDGRSLVITQPRQDNVDAQSGRYTKRAWLVDEATGEQTEIATPVDAWQPVAP